MKFDVVIGNPPYNSNIKYTVPTGLSKEGKSAANTRVDAAFIVMSKELLLKDDGHLIMVWPLSWMGLSKWSDFRNWASTKVKYIQILDQKKTFGKAARVNVAITYFNGINPLTDVTGYFFNGVTPTKITSNSVPFYFNELSKSIHEKVSKQPQIKLNSKKVGPFDVATSTAKCEMDDFAKASLSSAMFPLRINKEGKYYITCLNQQEQDVYKQWWYEPLPSFIVAIYSAGWQASLLNIGQLPDILKILNGAAYDRQLVYDAINLTQEEIEYLESKTYELFKIDGIKNKKQHN